MNLFKKQHSSDCAPLAKVLPSIDELMRVRSKHKFEIDYLITMKKMPFKISL